MKCKTCNKEHNGIYGSGKFCSKFCSYSRKLSDITKEKISNSLKNKPRKFFEYNCEICNNKFTSQKIRNNRNIRCIKCTRKVPHKKDINNINSILDLSLRTARKILKRLNKGCSNCNWALGTCDIHHINGRKIEDCDNHLNLSFICPNCHRLVHEGKIDKNKLINLFDYIGDEWKKYYCYKNVSDKTK